MLPTAQKLHTPPSRQEKFPLLVVSPFTDDFSAVRQILQNPCWQISHARNLEEAAISLKQMVASVVLCERDLPDGNWKDILPLTRELTVVPSVLVVSRHADDSLWADVLSCGGYDVLPKPFDRREVVRVISMAWRQCYAKNAAHLHRFAPAFAHAATN
jgi:DNA-binding response OmpR family regulator